MIIIRWKSYEKSIFSLSGLWCDLQKFLWPFSFFWDPWCLRSPVACTKFYFWTGFHHKKLTNQKSHSTSLWKGVTMKSACSWLVHCCSNIICSCHFLHTTSEMAIFKGTWQPSAESLVKNNSRTWQIWTWEPGIRSLQLLDS